MTIDVTKKYVATIHTAKGNIKVELDPSAAPQTVNNFIYLSQNGFYDGLTFHRVEPNFVIQGGDPLGNGTGGPGYTIPPEIKLTHVDGAIAMARTSGPPESTPNSGSQFYITIGAQPNLDKQYTVFGHAISGQDVVRKIAVGDVIQRVDITSETGASVAPPPVVAAPPVTCQTSPLGVKKDDHVEGLANAPVTIIEYGDMECPACGQVHPALKATYNTVSDTVQFVFRHFPLTTIHEKAQITAQALEAASLQNKFWEMHDLLYEKQGEWSSKPVTGFETVLTSYAKTLGLDTARFEKDLTSQPVIDRVVRDAKDAQALNLNATPSIFINGRPIQPDAFMQPGNTMSDQLRTYAKQRAQIITGAPAAAMSFDKPDQVAKSGSLYEMTLKTSKGDVKVELDPKLAPVNVNSTVFLAQKNFFDSTPIELNDNQLGAVLFGNASRQGNPGYSCGIEPPAPNSFTKPGVVALLNDSTNDTTQLIVTYSPTLQFESQFTVIGHVTSGLDVVKQLQVGDAKTPADKIITATVTTK
jgi:cyclophilin family peptidyl-prolyl cis-trans isomerase/predicted DsbA family dithiol-disulfide isomerase